MNFHGDPRVTVIIPCYNHGQFLEESVNSILEQTYTDYQIFIINDGSTEQETIDILKSFNKPKTKIFHKENGHLSSARNFGIMQTTSEYILTLDSDDMFERTFLEKAVHVLDNYSDVGVCTCLQQNFGISDWLGDPIGGGLIDFLAGNSCLASSLYRRVCWIQAGGYDESMKNGYEDWNFWIGVTKNGWRVHRIKDSYLKYRTKEVSMATESNKMRPELVRTIAQNHLEVYKNNVAEIVYRKECIIFNLMERIEKLENEMRVK